MIIENFKPFVGQHCETTTAGCLLYQLDIKLSEPLLFGLGEGLGYLYWNMKSMDFPFIGGRVKPDILTENLCRNLGLDLKVEETSSQKKAWTNVETPIQRGRVVGLKLDCYHLEYFNSKHHFAGHYAAMYGFDDDFAYLVDTDQQGCQVKTSLKNLELARKEKGPMSSRNRSFTIEQNKDLPDMETTIRSAIHNNAVDYLNPPIKNLGYKGIKKTAAEIVKWFNSTKDIEGDFQTTAMMMERAGTGGALFRNLYRDFLKESAEQLDQREILEAHEAFKGIAKSWTEVSALFQKVGDTREERYIHAAAEILLEISEQEYAAMEKLRIATK